MGAGLPAAPKPKGTGAVTNVFASGSTSPNPGPPPSGKGGVAYAGGGPNFDMTGGHGASGQILHSDAGAPSRGKNQQPGRPIAVNPGTQQAYAQPTGTTSLGGWGAVPDYSGYSPPGAPSAGKNPPRPAGPASPSAPGPFAFGGSSTGTAPDWRQRSQDASLEYLRPLQERRQASLESQLANMGLTRGSAAWDNEMQTLQDQNNRDNLGVYDTSRQETALAGNLDNMNFNQILAASGQNFNQNLASNQYNDTRYAQDRTFDLQDRSQSLNELNALLNGQQVGLPQMPGFTNSGVSAGPNYTGAAAQQGQWSQQQAANQNSSFGGLLGGAVGIGSAAMGAGGWGGLFGF